MSVGMLAPFAVRPSLAAVVPPLTRRLAGLATLLFGVLLVLVTASVALSRLRLG